MAIFFLKLTDLPPRASKVYRRGFICLGNLDFFLQVDARPAPPKPHTALLKEALARSNLTSFQAWPTKRVANFLKRDKMGLPPQVALPPGNYAVYGGTAHSICKNWPFFFKLTPPPPEAYAVYGWRAHSICKNWPFFFKLTSPPPEAYAVYGGRAHSIGKNWPFFFKLTHTHPGGSCGLRLEGSFYL